MRHVKLSVSAVVLLATLVSGGSPTERYTADYFRSPLGIPLFLSGSFAELRSNHFHSGLDIKTRNQSGYRVYSAAEGWVSRISVSPGGFGNAVYVSHPNGYMTVYAHLSKFNETLESYIRDQQYARQSFAVTLFPERGHFPLMQGEVLGFSGNSGSSGGPHLHFEVRDEATGWPVNPQLFDFDITDTLPPRAFRLKLYAIGPRSSLRVQDTRRGGWRTVTEGSPLLLDLARDGSRHWIPGVGRIEVNGSIAFGIQANDYHNGSNNPLGAFRIRLLDGDNLLFESEMDRFSFDQTRYLNAHIDYEERQRNGRWIQRSHILPGNQLPLYTALNSGVLEPSPGSSHSLRYEIEDSEGNISYLPIDVIGISSGDEVRASNESVVPAEIVSIDREFVHSTNGIHLVVSPGTVYEDTPFRFSVQPSPSRAFAPTYRILDRFVPMHRYASLSIDASAVPERLRNKAVIVRIGDGGSFSSAGGTIANGFLHASIRTFGDYTIAVDTTAPGITPLSFSPGRNMSRESSIRFRIGDNLAGIASYRGSIDGHWMLFEYDAKNRLLYHRFDERTSRGKHHLRLVLTDNVGNESTYSAEFTR